MTTATESSRRASRERWQTPVQLTPLYREHVKRSAALIEQEGWLLAQSYGEPAREVMALRTGAGLLDISEQGKISVKGHDLPPHLAPAFPGLNRFRVGEMVATQSSRLYPLTDDEALIVTPAAETRSTLDAMRSAADGSACMHVVDLTGALGGLRLLGPRAPAILERLSTLDLGPDRFPDGGCLEGGLARVHAVIARRDAAGLTGYDIYVDRDLTLYLWETMLHLGTPLQLAPVGREAEGMLG